ncbi:MAG: hypothetical protein KKH28_05295 [Elusimicrobia bacterium]|nr:hypothetical protein [Elusimicrobiota bacterium]
MREKMRLKPSLLRNRPLAFSPLYLNAGRISTVQLLAIYRFAGLFFPKLGPGIVQTLLDMERHSGRLRAGVAPEERRRLISDMKGMNMDIRYTLKEEGHKMLELSIHIVPSEVLNRAQQGEIDLNQCRQLREDFDKLIAALIEKEVRRRFTARVESLLHDSLGKPHVPPLVSRLLDMGWINGEGRLMEGVAIDDLLTGKHRAGFGRLAPEELIREGLQIRETIRTCFKIGAADTGLLIHDAKKRHAMLEITIRAAQDEGGNK